MSKSIRDSPWMRLLKIDYVNREDYQKLETWEDSNSFLDKVEAEIDAEIQAERIGKMKNNSK